MTAKPTAIKTQEGKLTHHEETLLIIPDERLQRFLEAALRLEIKYPPKPDNPPKPDTGKTTS